MVLKMSRSVPFTELVELRLSPNGWVYLRQSSFIAAWPKWKDTANKNIAITKPNKPIINVEKQNDLDSILSRVPMACDIKHKKQKKKLH